MLRYAALRCAHAGYHVERCTHINFLMLSTPGDVEVTAFSEIPRDTLLRSLESIDDAALESLGVKRGDGEAKAQAEGLLRGLKEALNKNNDKDDTPGSKTPSHKSKVDRPGSIRQARPAPAKLKGPLDS